MRLFALCILFVSLATHGVGQNSKPNPQKAATSSQDAADAHNPSPQIVIQSQSNQQSPNQQDASRNREKQGFLPSPQVGFLPVSNPISFSLTSLGFSSHQRWAGRKCFCRRGQIGRASCRERVQISV